MLSSIQKSHLIAQQAPYLKYYPFQIYHKSKVNILLNQLP